MIKYSRISIGFLSLLILVCVIICLPNFYQKGPFKDKPKISLGLDLKGGSYLLLEVDTGKYIEHKYVSVVKDLKRALNTNNINFTISSNRAEGIKLSLPELINSHLDIEKILRNASPEIASGEIKMNNKADHKGTNEFTFYYDKFALSNLNQLIMEQSIAIIRDRVDKVGTKELSIQRSGSNKIILQVPGLNNTEQLKRIVGKTAKLSFHLMADTQEVQVKEGQESGDVLSSKGELELGSEDAIFGALGEVTLSGYDGTGSYNIKEEELLTGDMLEDARLIFTEFNEAVVSFRLNHTGAKLFSEITTKNVGKPFAIVLDNKVVSAPVIREPIASGSGIISGNFSTDEAKELAILLRTGSLPAPMNVVEEKVIGPSLGSDLVEGIKLAGIISTVLVLGFMILYYRSLGLIADIALIVNVLIIISVLSITSSTLTLSGIAGIILTIGMAVDSNILIFQNIRERNREALRDGYSSSKLHILDSGFINSMATIIDANITTLIVGIVTYFLGGSLIKSFAISLSIGTISTIFTATIVTKILIAIWYAKLSNKLEKLDI